MLEFILLGGSGRIWGRGGGVKADKAEKILVLSLYFEMTPSSTQTECERVHLKTKQTKQKNTHLKIDLSSSAN